MPPPHALRIAAEIVRNLFARETLGEVAASREATQPVSERPTLLATIFAIETLPVDPEPPRRAERDEARGLFSAEALPEDPVPPPRARRRGILRALFAFEALSEDPAPPPHPRRRRWLSWLFGLESLE